MSLRLFLIFVLMVFSVLILSLGSAPKYHVFAHSFTSDDSAYFIGLAKQAAIELKLAQKNYPNNITLAMDHSDESARLINDVYYVDDNIVTDKDFMNRYNQEFSSSNATLYALVFADLLDMTLRNYADSINLNVDLTNMSNLAILDYPKESLNIALNTSNNLNSPESFAQKKFVSEYKKFTTNNNTVLDYSDYESAKALSSEVKNLFNDRLRDSGNVTNKSPSMISDLGNNLDRLNNIINSVGIPSELMQLVHLKIHPTLQQLYNLNIRSDMNMTGMDMGSMQMN